MYAKQVTLPLNVAASSQLPDPKRSVVECEQVLNLVNGALGKDAWRCEQFGAGKFSQTFRVNGTWRQYVVRVAPPDSMLQLFYERRMMRQEPEIHRRIQAETDIPTPDIVHFDFSRQDIDRDYLIMPLLPGTPLSGANLTRSAWDRALCEWGRQIAKLHTIVDAQNRFGYLGENHPMEPQSSWAAAFREMFRLELNDIVATGIYSRQIAQLALDLLDSQIEVFDHCPTSRLLHGDIWGTNLLVTEDGSVTGVLDFDRACWGDIEWDLAIAEYCGVTQKPFWEGYGTEVETHEGDAKIRRMFYLLYEHQKYVIIALSSRRRDPAGARRYASECLEILRNFQSTHRPDF